MKKTLLSIILGIGLISGCKEYKNNNSLIELFDKASDIKYISEEKGDKWLTPKETLLQGGGDCEDKAFFYHDLLRNEGIDSEVIFGLHNLLDLESGHAWVEYKSSDGTTYVADPVAGQVTRKDKLPIFNYFPINNNPIFMDKLEEYQKKVGYENINHTYQKMIDNKNN